MTDYEPISAEKALGLLQDAVAERGDGFVYVARDDDEAPCVYIDADGQPSCLVGLALTKAGVLAADIAEFENVAASGLGPALGVTALAAEVFQAAQQIQDGGGTWGDALINAKEKFAAIGGLA